MVDLEETLLGLFTEVAIVEHLTTTRVSRNFMSGLEAGHFGIINYFVRNHQSPDSVGGIAWAFQQDESITRQRVDALVGRGYLTLVADASATEEQYFVTLAGRQAREDQLARMAPDFKQLVAEIPVEKLQIAHEVLHEIRLTLDNLPDR
jgi:hypothetical protein